MMILWVHQEIYIFRILIRCFKCRIIAALAPEASRLSRKSRIIRLSATAISCICCRFFEICIISLTAPLMIGYSRRMNSPSLEKFESRVVKDGLIFINSSVVNEKVEREDLKAVYVPCETIAYEIGNPKVANMDRQVVKTYARFRGNEVLAFGSADGQADLDELERLLSEETAAVCIQSPNFYGCVEDIGRVSQLAHAKGAMLLVSCDPISLGLLKSPGELGADVVVGEAQCLGNPLNFGGPYLGFFAAKNESMQLTPWVKTSSNSCR